MITIWIVFMVRCLVVLFLLELLKELLEEMYYNVTGKIIDWFEDAFIFIAEKIKSWGPQC